MKQTWQAREVSERHAISPMGWVRVVLRGTMIAIITFGSLFILLLVRLIERPLCGVNRPVTPFITQFVCRTAFYVLGMGFSVTGRQLAGRGAVVSNHASWLDIFALNARKRVYFVSKSEVANWPGIGWLARATGTVFINREAREARQQKAIFEERLNAGHKLLFFPEGTSTDGLRVLPFKSTLFAAFFTDGLRDSLSIQPVTLIYRAPEGEEPQFYGWWGDMEFAGHLLKTLSVARQGSVEVVYHPPVRVSDFAGRKALAAYCEQQVRAALPVEISSAGALIGE